MTVQKYIENGIELFRYEDLGVSFLTAKSMNEEIQDGEVYRLVDLFNEALTNGKGYIICQICYKSTLDILKQCGYKIRKQWWQYSPVGHYYVISWEHAF